MILELIQAGPLMVNCYIVGDEESQKAAVFDPGGDVDKIISVVQDHALSVESIINTHTHWDHTGGNRDLQEYTGAPIVIHRDEAPGLQTTSERAAVYASSAPNSEASRFVQEGDIIETGALRFRVIDLRGHSPAGLGFVFEGELEIDGSKESRRLVICGDALFSGSIGRTDFPGGDMNLLLENIRTKIFTLPPDTLILPGHGPVTTVAQEKAHNPFFRT